MKKSFLLVFCLILLCVLTACSSAPEETQEYTMGIDVAKYQGTIDWAKVADHGVDFTMVRVGYRAQADGQIKPDSNALYNLQQAQKYGIKLGVYFFSTAVSEEEAQEEADWVADFIAQYAITYPVAYDCEGYGSANSRQYGMSATKRTNVALAFLKRIEKHGYEGMFYSSKSELLSQWETPRIEDDYKIWVAQYPDSANPPLDVSSYSGTHHMWQYSDEGTIPGIEQPVDLNFAYFGYEGTAKPMSSKEPVEAFPDVEALMEFEAVNEIVTAKEETNLRNMPSQGEESETLYQLKNGETATRIGISSAGWSKLDYNGHICYAVTNYLTTDMGYIAPDSLAQSDLQTEPQVDDGIETVFYVVNEYVTAKEYVNLRALPSATREDATIITQLHNGDRARRIGISDEGWSKLEYQGRTLYCVSSYLTVVEDAEPVGLDVEMKFEEISDFVTPKKEVNLRTYPSTTDKRSEVIVKVGNGVVLTRTGINEKEGWSRIEYQGQILYCVSRLLTTVE